MLFLSNIHTCLYNPLLDIHLIKCPESYNYLSKCAVLDTIVFPRVFTS